MWEHYPELIKLLWLFLLSKSNVYFHNVWHSPQLYAIKHQGTTGHTFFSNKMIPVCLYLIWLVLTWVLLKAKKVIMNYVLENMLLIKNVILCCWNPDFLSVHLAKMGLRMKNRGRATEWKQLKLGYRKKRESFEIKSLMLFFQNVLFWLCFVFCV